MHNIRNGAIRWLIPEFLIDGNSNVSHHLRDIRQNKKMQKF